MCNDGTKYMTCNLWEAFCAECQIASRIPFFNHWMFGLFVKAYFEHKQPLVA